MEFLPPIILGWMVRSWVQVSLGACVLYQLEKKKSLIPYQFHVFITPFSWIMRRYSSVLSAAGISLYFIWTNSGILF
jgi:hypothetical protein